MLNSTVVSALISAAYMLVSAVAIRWAESTGFMLGGSERIGGVILGISLAWTGYQLPKWIAEEGLSAKSEVFRMRRTAAGLMMLGGLGYALAWVAAPLAIASDVAKLPVVVAAVSMITLFVVRRRAA